MIDIIREAESRLFNTISLDDLLRQADLRFRTAVIGALIREGFELDESVPCLQHPREILDSIHWLEALDFGTPWESFKQTLLAAGKLGILMDLSNRAAEAEQSMPSLGPEWVDGYDHSQLKTA